MNFVKIIDYYRSILTFRIRLFYLLGYGSRPEIRHKSGSESNKDPTKRIKKMVAFAFFNSDKIREGNCQLIPVYLFILF